MIKSKVQLNNRRNRGMVAICAALIHVTGVTVAASPLVAQTMLDTLPRAAGTRITAVFAPGSNDQWLFSFVAEAAVDSKGQTFVLDNLDHKIHVFNSAGRHVRTLGREGSGPGEFRRPRDLQIIGDTVFVRDRGNRRYVSFAAATGASIPNKRGAAGDYAYGLSPWGEYSSVTVKPGADVRAGSAVRIEHRSIATAAPTNLGQYVLARGALQFPTFRGRLPNPALGQNTRPTGAMSTLQPFDDSPIVARRPDGTAVVFVERPSSQTSGPGVGAARNPAAQITIRTVDAKAGAISNRKLAVKMRPLTASDVSLVVDSLTNVSPAAGIVFVARPADIRDSLFIPKFWPTVTEAFAGNDGSVWLRQPQPPGAPTKFWRIDGSGALLRAVTVGGNPRVLLVQRDVIWLATSDADGAPIVEVHRVTTP